MTGEGAVSVPTLLHIGTGSLKELLYLGFLCVCVCVFLPFRYEFLAFTYFPLSCGAVPPSGARTQHNHLAALVFELLCAHQGDRHAHHVLQP